MISRVAALFLDEPLLERAENTARVLDVNQTLLFWTHRSGRTAMEALLIISGIHDFAEHATASVQQHLTWDPENRAASASSLNYARENAGSSAKSSAWRCGALNYYYLWMQGPVARAMYDTTAPNSTARSAHQSASSTVLRRGRCRTARPGLPGGRQIPWSVACQPRASGREVSPLAADPDLVNTADRQCLTGAPS